MNKAFFAKSLGWLGGAITALGTSGQFGKYSGLAGMVGPFLVSIGIHLASQTGPALPK